MKHLSFIEVGLRRDHPEPEESHNLRVVSLWLARGDGIAVYENQELGHPDMGHRKLVSYGSEEAQLVGEPPLHLPDIGSDINWRYQLVGVYDAEDFLRDALGHEH